MTRLLIISFFVIYADFLSACSPAENQPQTLTEVSLSDTAEVHVLVDDLSLLGNISDVIFLNDNRFIVSDRKPAVSLFKNYEMVATFGSEGKGPCEYTNISAIDVQNNVLYVLNSSQSKIIKFDIITQECLGEINHESLSKNSYLHRLASNTSFLIGRTAYIASTPDSISIIQALDSKENLQSLSLTIGRINPVETNVPIRFRGLNFSHSEQTLHAYFPLTDSLYKLNLKSMQFASFPLKINIKREEIENAGPDIQKILEIIQGGEFDFVTRIIPSSKWLAIEILQPAAGENEKPTTYLQFYTLSGEFIGEVFTQHQTFAYHNGKLVEIRQSTDPNAEHTYSMAFREVILK